MSVVVLVVWISPDFILSSISPTGTKTTSISFVESGFCLAKCFFHPKFPFFHFTCGAYLSVVCAIFMFTSQQGKVKLSESLF